METGEMLYQSQQLRPRLVSYSTTAVGRSNNVMNAINMNVITCISQNAATTETVQRFLM